jgi:hypothetical protein
MYGNVMGQLDAGRICPEPKGAAPPAIRQSSLSNPELHPDAGTVRSVSQKPNKSQSKLEILEFQNEVLLATVEMLRNETARGILHSIELPKDSEYEQYLNISTRQSTCVIDACFEASA